MDITRNKFIVGLAGMKIEVDTISSSACVLCRNYLQNGKVDFGIKVSQEDIDKEFNDKQARNNRVSAETIAVYRKIVEQAIDYDTMLMHGAVIAIGGKAYMFSAPSGTGKTTHIRLWLKNAIGSFVVNGDKPLIRFIDDTVYACGTPWSGNENMNSNTIVPLESIVILERDEDNRIDEIGFSEAYPYLLRQTYIPRDIAKAKKVFSLLSSLYGKVSFWHFHCNNFRDDCFETSYHALVEKK